MLVQFKFKPDADDNARREVIKALRTQGGRAVRQLFPGDENKELARLYVAAVSDRSVATKVVSLLKRSAAVEFAEPEVTRRLIR